MEENHPTAIAEETLHIYIDKIENVGVPDLSIFQFLKY